MRVIAGIYRSRHLISPAGNLTRPTSDRLRETLFNVLQPRINGARFADLYAGTGAVGIEALSRGAAHVLFSERAAPALEALRANLQSLGITTNFSLEPRSSTAALERILERSESLDPSPPLDIVFVDPPYNSAADYTNILTLLGSARAANALSPDALVIAEHSSKRPLPERFGYLRQTRTLQQGDASLTFYASNAANIL